MTELSLGEIKKFIDDDEQFEYSEVQDLVRKYLTWARAFKMFSFEEKLESEDFILGYLEREYSDRIWTLRGFADDFGNGDNRISAGFTNSAPNIRGWILTMEPFTPGYQDVILEVTLRCKRCDVWGEPETSVEDCSECNGGEIYFQINPIADE
jgi:hypothetical protein